MDRKGVLSSQLQLKTSQQLVLTSATPLPACRRAPVPGYLCDVAANEQAAPHWQARGFVTRNNPRPAGALASCGA